MEITYYLGSSADGFIARDDGDVSWMDELDIPYDHSGYNEFFASIDGLIMGRKTYQMVQDFGSWPYEDKPTWVCSSGELESMEGCNLQTESAPAEAVAAAEKAGLKHLWCVGGAVLAGALLENDLLDKIFITQLPVLLGSGIPMFSPSSSSKKLQLQSSRAHAAGFSQMIYQVVKDSSARLPAKTSRKNYSACSAIAFPSLQVFARLLESQSCRSCPHDTHIHTAVDLFETVDTRLKTVP